MVYISDRSMYNDVYLASALDGKVFKKLISGERTPSFETLRFFNTSIAWAPGMLFWVLPILRRITTLPEVPFSISSGVLFLTTPGPAMTSH